MDGSPAELRGKAERYRRLASTVTDAQALKALCELAARYEALAAELEKQVRPQVKILCRRGISVNPLAGPGQVFRPGRPPAWSPSNGTLPDRTNARAPHACVTE